MNTASLARWLERLAWWAGLGVLSIGVLVLLGWGLGERRLATFGISANAMVPGTALGFVLMGALQLAAVHQVRTAFKDGSSPGLRACRLAVLALVGIGGIRLVYFLAGRDCALDLLGFALPAAWHDAGRMSPGTALAFLTLGLALGRALRPKLFRSFQLLVSFAGLLGLLGLNHYIFGGQPVYPVANMATPTALGVIVMALGLLCLRPDSALMGLLLSPGPGGIMARRLYPAILLAPVLLGWLSLQGYQSGWYGLEGAFGVFTLGCAAFFGGVVWATASAIEQADRTLRQMETAEHQSQNLLRAISDNSPAIIVAKDREGRYLFINRSYSVVFQVEAEEVIGRTDADLFPSEVAANYRELDQRVIREGKTLVAEEVAQLDGVPHTYVSVKSPLRDHEGRIYGTFGISTDITEHKQTQLALAASEQKYRRIFELSPLPKWIYDPQTLRFLAVNQATLLQYGYTETEFLGMTLRDLHLAEDIAGLEADVAMERTETESNRGEHRHRRKDGSLIEVIIYVHDIDLDGRRARMVVAQDISERKQAERKLREQLARLKLLHRVTRATGERQDLRSIFQAVIGGMEQEMPIDFSCLCLCDENSEKIEITCIGARSDLPADSVGLAEQTRLNADQNGLTRCLRGQLVYEPDLQGIRLPFAERLVRGGMRSLVVTPLQVESNVFGLLVAARRTVDGFSSGDSEFLRQLAEHIALATHQGRLYEALQRAYDDLRQTQQIVLQQERLRALGQMASGIAHDINNAISPVTLYVESLLETESSLNERTRGYLEIIQHAVGDVAATVARMREFYRQGEPQLTLTPVALNDLVTQVTSLTRARWQDMPQQRGIVITLQLELAAGLPPVLGVESEIREALTNLILNAVDAMPQGGILRVSTYCPAAAPDALAPDPLPVRLEVADTGVGMDEETRRHCLEPFFTTKGERGTGLGLAMVYGVLQRHNAEIAIESAPGRGTTVLLRFAPIRPGTELPDVPADGLVGTVRWRLLIVDDDPLLLKSLRDLLERDGHQVTTAGDGQAGIDTFLAPGSGGGRFDLVITDLGMPYVDGRRVASAVKAASPDTPVILLTGWGQRLVDEGDIPAHVDLVLSKPPRLRELRSALSRCWRARRVTPTDGNRDKA